MTKIELQSEALLDVHRQTIQVHQKKTVQKIHADESPARELFRKRFQVTLISAGLLFFGEA